MWLLFDIIYFIDISLTIFTSYISLNPIMAILSCIWGNQFKLGISISICSFYAVKSSCFCLHICRLIRNMQEQHVRISFGRKFLIFGYTGWVRLFILLFSFNIEPDFINSVKEIWHFKISSLFEKSKAFCLHIPGKVLWMWYCPASYMVGLCSHADTQKPKQCLIWPQKWQYK